MRGRSDSSAFNVRLNSKSLPSPVGRQAEGMAPFGKNRNAARSGAPLAAVASLPAGAANRLTGRSDSNAGSAMQAPMPRRKWRRLKFKWRSRAMFRVWLVFISCCPDLGWEIHGVWDALAPVPPDRMPGSAAGGRAAPTGTGAAPRVRSEERRVGEEG